MLADFFTIHLLGSKFRRMQNTILNLSYNDEINDAHKSVLEKRK